VRILIFHRIPFQEIHYDRVIDHALHDVIYVGTRRALADIPAELRCIRLERPGRAPVWEEALEATAELPPPDRVVSLSELELLDAAKVREALGVPGPRPDAVRVVRDKVRMKEAVRAGGLRAPRFAPCAAVLEAPSAPGALPWAGATVLKPRMGACSRDMVVFPTARDAAVAVREGRTGLRAFTAEEFELEEYIAGRVIHVDGLLIGGEPFGLVASRYVNTCLEYARLGVPLGSVELPCSDALERWATACARAVGIQSGVFHLEGILAAEGLTFLEISARVGVASIVDVVGLVHGIQLNAAMLSLEVFGRAAIAAAAHHHRDAGAYGWFVFAGHHLGPGRLRIEGAQRFAGAPHVHRWVQLPEGAPLPDHISYAPEDAPLSGVVRGRDTAEVEGFLRALFDGVRVRRVEAAEAGALPQQRALS
jgi:hypothetical protein